MTRNSYLEGLSQIALKERNEREKDIENVKRRVDEEKDELKQLIDRDRDNMTRKMNEEHDQRRIEQLEMTQRLGE